MKTLLNQPSKDRRAWDEIHALGRKVAALPINHRPDVALQAHVLRLLRDKATVALTVHVLSGSAAGRHLLNETEVILGRPLP
jgi:hypothetical protein